MDYTLKFHYFDQVESTQTLAKSINLQPQTLHVLVAFEQLCGKGTFGKAWVSPKDSGLYLSIAFHLRSLVPKQTLSLLTVAACCQTMQDLSPEIKWPNDLLIKGKKIGGILCEVLEDRVVIGVGINLKIPKNLLEKIDQPATSWNEYAIPPKIDALAGLFSTNFLHLLKIWCQHGFKGIKSIYTTYFPLMHQEVFAELPEGLLKGVLIDFSDDGYPMLKVGDLLQTLKHVKHLSASH